MWVLTEVRAGPRGDERRTFRRAVKTSVLITCFLYIMVNVAFVSENDFQQLWILKLI